jgi:hypothetical protein
MSARGARHELLGSVRSKLLKAIDADVFKQPLRIRAVQKKLGHVVRLIEQDCSLTPSALLGPPITDLRRHKACNQAGSRSKMGSDRIVMKVLNEIRGPIDKVLQGLTSGFERGHVGFL